MCETNGGDDANQQCVFPFSYEGVTYEHCTSVGNNGTQWCSTEVDENGEYVSGKWGNCGSGCFEDNDALLLGNKKIFLLDLKFDFSLQICGQAKMFFVT